jgi:hypothetical protein
MLVEELQEFGLSSFSSGFDRIHVYLNGITARTEKESDGR